MKTKQIMKKKLNLNKNTISNLESSDLKKVIGGAVTQGCTLQCTVRFCTTFDDPGCLSLEVCTGGTCL